MSDTSYTPVHLDPVENKVSDDFGTARAKPRASSIFSVVSSKIGHHTTWSRAWKEVLYFFQDSYHASGPLVRRGGQLIRNANWRHLFRLHGMQILLWMILVGWFLLSAYVGNDVGRHSTPSSGDDRGGCSPAGEWIAPFNGSFSNWDISSTFQITLGFGHLSFSTAKFIDVAWDVAVGRGGQGLLAVISYIVFSKSLMRFMEDSSVSYGTFEALTFQTASTLTIFKLIRDFYSNATARAKIAVFWMILASIWVAAFPTFTSAMSGYSANIGEYITDRDQSLIPWNDFRLIYFIIHDGWRIPGLQGEHQVLAPGGISDSPSAYVGDDVCQSLLHNSEPDPAYLDPETRPCLLVYAIAEYNAAHETVSDANSTFNNTGNIINLGPPTLNITRFFLPAYYPMPNATDHSSTSYYSNYYERDRAHWAHDNLTYDHGYISSSGACQQQKTYKWGFSFLLLFIFCIIQSVWSLGMYIMYMDAYMKSRFERAGRDMGTHRAALDFAKAIRKDMGEEATEELGDRELRQRVRRKLNGGVIRMEMLDHGVLPASRSEDLKIRWRMGGGWRGRFSEVKMWSFRKKVWVGFAVVCLLLVIIVPSVTLGGEWSGEIYD